MMNYGQCIPFLLLGLTLQCATAALGQRILVPITVRNGGKTIVDTIGFHPNATYCIDGRLDSDLVERELPPMSLSVLDARFVDHRPGAGCLGVGMAIHIQEYGKTDTFRLDFQPGDAGYPLTFSWPPIVDSRFESLTIGIPDALIEPVDMLAETTVLVSNPLIGTLDIVGRVKPFDPYDLRTPLWLTDSTGIPFYPHTLWFGVNPGATTCLDDSLGEFYFITECGLFSTHCAQFLPLPDSTCEEDDSPVFLDLRGVQNTIQADTYQIGIVGTHPVVLRWPDNLSTYYHACRLVDYGSFYFGLPPRIDIDMLTVDSAIVSDSGEGYQGDVIIRAYGPYKHLLSVEPEERIPRRFELFQNYPNPFNPSTSITYSLPSSSGVSLRIFNILGETVATLVDGVVAPGRHSIEWNADGLPGGVYFYRLAAGEYVEARQMMLLK